MKKSEFIEALSEVKTNNTKSYLVHVSIIDLGIFDDLRIEDINKFLFSSLVKIFGKNSTFSTMTPFYEYADKKREFDLKRSIPSKEIGSFSKFIFNKKNSHRSKNPLFNICSVGPLAKKITNSRKYSDFETRSSWDNLFKLNTEMIFIGCDLSKCTFIRYIEHKFKVPYLIKKTFNIKIKSDNRVIGLKSSSTLRNLNLKIIYDTTKFQNSLKKKGFLKISSNKNFNLMSLKMKPAFKVGIESLRKDTLFFLNKKVSKI